MHSLAKMKSKPKAVYTGITGMKNKIEIVYKVLLRSMSAIVARRRSSHSERVASWLIVVR